MNAGVFAENLGVIRWLRLAASLASQGASLSRFGNIYFGGGGEGVIQCAGGHVQHMVDVFCLGFLFWG